MYMRYKYTSIYVWLSDSLDLNDICVCYNCKMIVSILVVDVHSNGQR